MAHNKNEDKQVLSFLDSNQKDVYKHFNSKSWLGSKDNLLRLYEYTTFFRRNFSIFNKMYLGITSYPYQELWIDEMAQHDYVTIVGARSCSKTFLISLYACDRAILYPGSKIVVCSGTKGQGQLLVSKIQKELSKMSPMLNKEIKTIHKSQVDTSVEFKNHSEIFVVVLSENSRGYRANYMVVDECRNTDKSLIDSIIAPMLISRSTEYKKLTMYVDNPLFIEEPGKIYISSSTDDKSWLYKNSVNAVEDMLHDGDNLFLAFDYSVTLKHGIKTRKNLLADMREFDPLTTKIEYFNRVLRNNLNSYFDYHEMSSQQKITKAFYPRNDDDVVARIKNKYSIPKLEGEVRIISCDIAFVDRNGNDNSCYSLMRLIPDSNDVGQRFYRVQLVYIETSPGRELKSQAIRIRQLYDDFQADYLILDTRNGGIGVYDLVARTLHDSGLGVDYPPFKAMNDEVIASRVNIPDADACVFCINASPKLNSEIAINFKMMLVMKQVEFLVNRDVAIDEIRRFVPIYNTTNDPEVRLFYDKPYLETSMMISESVNLLYEKMPNTGLIRVYEHGKNTKDRYTSVSYGAFFANLLGRDLLGMEDEYTLETAPICVSDLKF